MPTEADSLLPICFIIPFARNPSFTEEPIDLPHPPSTVVILSWVQLKVNFLDFQVHTFAVSSPATSPRSFQQHHPSRPAVLERAPKSCFVCVRVGSRLLAMTDPELLPKMVNFVSFELKTFLFRWIEFLTTATKKWVEALPCWLGKKYGPASYNCWKENFILLLGKM